MCVLFAVAVVVAWCTLSLLNSVKETLFTKTTLTTLFAQIYLKTYFTFNNWKQQKLSDTSLLLFPIVKRKISFKINLGK